MGFSIKTPLVLLLIPVVFFILFVTMKKLRMKNTLRRQFVCLIRGAVLLFLIFAMAGISFHFNGNAGATVFLLDMSDSTASSQEKMMEEVKEALRKMPEREQAAVVAFGKNSKVEQFLSSNPQFAKVETTPVTTATNLEKAVETAMGIYPSGAGKRMVLITDGQENEGNLKEMVSQVTASKVDVQVMRLEKEDAQEVYVDSVTIPEQVDVGDHFQVQVTIVSNVNTTAEVSLYQGNTRKKKIAVELAAGENQFVFSDTQKEAGLKNYRVTVEAVKDTLTVNNEYVSYTNAKTGDVILLIEGKKGESSEFQKVLNAANIAYDVIVPGKAPRNMVAMQNYQAMILLDVHQEDLPEGFLNNIDGYVKDYAGAVAAIGGENSFALGNYKDTPLEDILPVYMDLRGEKEVPKMAMTLVIDHSGSMSDGNRYQTCLSLAKEAANGAVDNLREDDLFGVIAFDDAYDWVVKLGTADQKDSIKDTINSIPLGGGTSIYPALNAAVDGLIKSDAKIRHVILLTDGQDSMTDYEDLIKKAEENGVTISTVAVGTGSDQKLLKQLAENGGGRYYYTDINSDMPRIFAQEVFLSARAYLVNETFVPEISSNSSLISEVTREGIPALHGYVAATPKEMATVHLKSDQDDPILTTWQYGLGKTVAFQSDGTGEWTGEWAKWDQYPVLWKNLLRWMITPQDTDGDLSISQQGSSVHITYEAAEYDSSTTVFGVYTDSEGNDREIQLKASRPGVYEADVNPDEAGVYSLNVTKKDGEHTSSVNRAFAVQYSREYRFSDDSDVLDQFVNAVDGKWLTGLDNVFSTRLKEGRTTWNLTNLFLMMSLLLFLLDIVNRRLDLRIPEAVRQKKESLAENRNRKVQNKEVEKAAKKPEKTVKKQKSVKKEKKEEPEYLDMNTLLKKKKERDL